MKIEISNKLRPFSHTTGCFTLIPGSSLRLQAFPTFFQFDDLSGPKIKEFQKLEFKLHGLVAGFTVQQDLERGAIFVWGSYKEGYVRFKIVACEKQGFTLTLLRGPSEGVKIININKVILPKQTLFFSSIEKKLHQSSQFEKLILGVNKAQDFDLIKRRLDLKEIFPFWFALGQLVPEQKINSYQGTLSLLEKCQTEVNDYINLFQAGFEGIMSPRLIDIDHLGFNITTPDQKFKGSPLALLSEGAKLIRSLFISYENNTLHILPTLPKEFHSGRLINVEINGLGSVDIEWSKKKIRRLIIRAKQNMDLNLKFQSEIKNYRLTRHSKEKGKYLPAASIIKMDASNPYFFDNFKK